MAAPRAVVVTRPTEYEELLGRHGTRRNVEFFLEQRGQTVDNLDRRHTMQATAITTVAGAIPTEWRRASVLRADLDRWLFEPDDVVIAVGQDGLVANVAKYLDGQPVVGVNPDPEHYQGALVRVAPDAVSTTLQSIVNGSFAGEVRAMVQLTTDDGQTLKALNEVFIGQANHQSARYDLLLPDGSHESQSSSGIVIGTGTGATGWCASLWNDRRPAWSLPERLAPGLCWFVREAWPSIATGVTLTSGLLSEGDSLRITARTDGLVVFGDGIEADRIELQWGQTATVTTSESVLHVA